MGEKKSSIESSNDIFNILRKELLNLAILPGDQLLESAICDRFGASRPTIRTVFQRLSDQGLIEIIPYKGVYATLLDLDYIYEIILLRIALESKIVTDFIASDPDSFILEEIDHNLRKQKILIEQEQIDETAFFSFDIEFHQLWFNQQRCRGLWDLIQQQEVQYTRFRMLDFIATLKYEDIVGNHIEIFQAIKEKRSDQIENLFGRHLNGGVARMGDKIKTEYARYFTSTDNIQYWQNYNEKYFMMGRV